MSRLNQVRSEAAYALYFPNNTNDAAQDLADVAFGYVHKFSPETIGADSAVVFDTPGLVGGMIATTAGFTIITTGIYAFDYRVEGTPSTGTSQLLFEIDINGITVPFTQFESDGLVNADTPLEEVVSGTGIIQLTAGDVVTLRNITNGGVDTVSLSGIADITVYAAFRLIKLDDSITPVIPGPPPPPTVPSLLPVPLLKASKFVGITKAGIANTPTSSITGNIAVSPAAATSLTGFSLVLDGSGRFSTSAQVVGHVFAADYAPPTPTDLTVAVLDMQAAYTNAASRPAGVTGLAGGNLGGLTLPPGVYKWTTGVTIPTDVTLLGSDTDVWIMQIDGTLSLSASMSVLLSGGALPKNVFWQVAGAITLHASSNMVGVILAQTNIAMQANATLIGRLYAQTAVTLISNTIVSSG
jgi:hypothetical protein